MGRHRAARRAATTPKMPLLGLMALLVTGALVGAGLGLAEPGVEPSASSAVSKPVSARMDVPRVSRSRARKVAPEVVLEEKPTDALPEQSGEGRRVVFSQSRQRVWLVGRDRVERTYLVSGSVYDNLQPGAYEVWSRSEQAYGIDDSGTMRWFVRFAHGPRAAIGFHDIPVSGGEPVQTRAELGTPLSHGCVRQHADDAIALWEFAPLGTPVVVVA